MRKRAAMVTATMLTMRSIHSTAPHSSNISSLHKGGRTSISTSPTGHPIQPSLAPSSTTSSSKPGGRTSGRGTSPETRVTMHVPHVPDEQFVGIETPASSASSTKVNSACTVLGQAIVFLGKTEQLRLKRWFHLSDQACFESNDLFAC